MELLVADAKARVMLLDTASLYFRAFYGVPTTFTAPDGTVVNAVRGLTDFMARLIRDYAPTHFVACWDDDWRPQFRVDAIPTYKTHRVDTAEDDDSEEVPDLLAPQVPLIVELLELTGIARVGSPGYEADDVIGTMTERTNAPVRIVTGDRDLFQLVDDDKGVAVLYTASKGVGRAEIVDLEWLSNKYAIPAGTYSDFALLRGDPSDGLPGVKGIGERTAASLLREFSTLAAIRAAAEDPKSSLRPAMRRRLLDASDYLDIAPSVVNVARDVPLPDDLDLTLPTAPRHPDKLAAWAEDHSLQSSVQRLTDALAKAAR